MGPFVENISTLPVDLPLRVWAAPRTQNWAQPQPEQAGQGEPSPSDCPVPGRAFSWIRLILPPLNLLPSVPPSWRLTAHCSLIAQDLFNGSDPQGNTRFQAGFWMFHVEHWIRILSGWQQLLLSISWTDLGARPTWWTASHTGPHDHLR